jgi:hypothetical protein
MRIARRGVAHGSGLSKVRWVVERAFPWLHAFKRPGVSDRMQSRRLERRGAGAQIALHCGDDVMITPRLSPRLLQIAAHYNYRS